MFLNIFLSKVSRACSSFVNVHASAPYDTTDLMFKAGTFNGHIMSGCKLSQSFPISLVNSTIYIKGKGKVIPLQARCGPEGA